MLTSVDPLSIARIADRWIALCVPVALKGSLLVGLLFLADRALRPASASVRHLMWAVGIIGLLQLPGLEAGLPSWRVVPIPNAVQLRAPAPALVRGVATPLPVAVSDAATAVEHARDPGRPDGARNRATAVPVAVWCLLLWLLGMLPLCLAMVRGALRLRRLRREALPLAGDEWSTLLRSLCRDIGVGVPPALLVSRRLQAPMTWGLRHPVVLLPRDCPDWPRELRQQVLLHELAHVKRRDCLTQFAAQCACLFHWFNPLVWMAARQMRVEREWACDDLVLESGALPSTYARHLLQMARHLGAREWTLSAGLAMADQSRIFNRLNAVLDPQRRRQAPGRRTVALATGLILALVAGLSAVHPAAKAAEKAPSAVGGGERHPASPPDLSSALAAPLASPLSLDTFATGRSRSCEYEANGIRVKMSMSGRIEFKPDFIGIVRMDEDASFQIEEKRGRRSTSLRAEAGNGGQPRYDFRIGRNSRPFDAEGAAWLASTIEFIMRESGIGADERVRRVHEEGGLGRVLALIDQIDSESVQSTYYCALFALDDLRDDEIVQTLQRVGHDIDSDYVRASILISYVDGYLHREGTRDAFLACLSTIASDYERCRVLQSGLHREDRTPGEMVALLAAVGDMKSDYEAAQFLAAFEPDRLADEGTRRAYFAALDGLESPHEKAEVLTTLARRAPSDPHLREACIEAAQRLDSYSEYSRVVRALR
jgi:beta-lactamase regulating signal transducer with metallopeptidase domain